MLNKGFLTWLFQDNKFIELRHQTHVDWKTYWFNNPDDLACKVKQLSWTGNLFINLNRPYEITGKAVTNGDIERHTRLLFDLDPIRPPSTSSTEEELEASRDVAIRLVSQLTALGWPIPLKAISGNGTHIQYRTSLINNSETKDILKALYTGLKTEFSTESVEFDTTVKNSGRIVALYGTTKRKGISTIERPHRQSIALTPEKWTQVSLKQVEKLANFYQKKSTGYFEPLKQRNVYVLGNGDYKTLNSVLMFQNHGLYLTEVEPNKHYVVCPWSHEHSSSSPTDTVIWENNGLQWPTFHCSHTHCNGRTIKDVIQLFGDADFYCSKRYI